MQKAIRFVGELIPGFVLALAIATVAYFTAQIQVGENVHGAVTIGSYIGASVIALFKDCEPIWEKDGETAALVYNVNEGELEKILSGLDAAPYIRMFDC